MNWLNPYLWLFLLAVALVIYFGFRPYFGGRRKAPNVLAKDGWPKHGHKYNDEE